MHVPSTVGRKWRRGGAALALGLALAVPACGSSTPTSSGSPSSPSETTASSASGATIDATEKDFSIALGSSTAQTGSVTFDITNNGPSTHEFVVFQTDLTEDQLPLSDDETEVDEEGEGLTAVDEVEDIKANTSGSLTVDLQPGSYVVICNLPGHYKLGMHAAFTVS